MSAGRVPSHIAYLRACIEADHAAVEHHPAVPRPSANGRDSALLLERGPAPLTSTTPLPQSNRAKDWVAAQREATSGSVTWMGWPVARGVRRVDGHAAEVLAGLLITEVRLTAVVDDDGHHTDALAPGDRAPVLSETALDLLGLPSDERESLRRAFDDAITNAVGDDPAPGSWLAVALGLLADHGVAATGLDTEALAPVDTAVALSNTAVVWSAQAATSPYTEALVRDLDALAASPEGAGPPLAALLAVLDDAPPVVAELPAPGIAPLVHPTTPAGEQVIAAAAARSLTTVEVPAAASRADLVANLAAAAVTRGETVLIAARSARSLDRLDRHLRDLGPEVTPIRAGLTGQRDAAARRMRQAVRAEPAPRALPPRDEAEAEWIDSTAAAAELYDRWSHRAVHADQALQARAQADQAAATLAVAAGLSPDGLGPPAGWGDPTAIEAAAREARVALAPGSGRERRWLPTRRRSTEKGTHAAADKLLAAFGPALRAAAGAASETGGHDALVALADATLAAAEARARADALTERDEALDLDGLAAELDAATRRRAPLARRFVRAAWAEKLSPPARLRSTLRLFQAGLTEKADGGDLEGLHRMVPDVLQVFPVWLAPTSLVGAWFPLAADLFDLVIIDDAAQSDVASALPALARGRRAIVIGDPADLPPVSHVTAGLDQQLARLHGVDDDSRRRLSYRGRSLFEAAVAATGRPPLLLSTRSHPHRQLGHTIESIDDHGDRAAPSAPIADVHTATTRLRMSAGDAAVPDGRPAPVLQWIDHAGGFSRGPNGRSGWNADEALAVVDQLLALAGSGRRPEPARAGPDRVSDRRPGGLSAQFSGLDDDESCIDFAAFGGRLRDAAYRRAEIAEARGHGHDESIRATPDAELHPSATAPPASPERATVEVDIDLVADDASGNRPVADADADTGAPSRPAIGLDVDLIDLRADAVGSIGVITMLSAHRDALRGLVRERFGNAITVDAPEGFRGEERDVIVLSLAVGPDAPGHLVDLVADARILATAIGRARRAVVIVGDRAFAAQAGGPLAELAAMVADAETGSVARSGRQAASR